MRLAKGKRQYHAVLDIPAAVLNDFEIEHFQYPAGYEFHTASVRTQLFAGHRDEIIVYQEPTTWHRLKEAGGTWMTDLVIEQAQIDNELKNIKRGSVLVGGLGLGYAATVLAQRKEIREVVVVEKQREVIELVSPYLLKNNQECRSKIKFIRADLFDYLKATKEKFTNAYYDIWASDGEITLHKIVIPLLRLSKGVVKNAPISWNENVMRGQLFENLSTKLIILSGKLESFFTLADLCEQKGNIHYDWYVPFFRNLDKFDDKHLAARYYASIYGTANWEKLWQKICAS